MAPQLTGFCATPSVQHALVGCRVAAPRRTIARSRDVIGVALEVIGAS